MPFKRHLSARTRTHTRTTTTMQAEASERAQHAQEYATHADDAFHAGPTPIAALEVRHLGPRFDRDSSMRCAI